MYIAESQKYPFLSVSCAFWASILRMRNRRWDAVREAVKNTWRAVFGDMPVLVVLDILNVIIVDSFALTILSTVKMIYLGVF